MLYEKSPNNQDILQHKISFTQPMTPADKKIQTNSFTHNNSINNL